MQGAALRLPGDGDAAAGAELGGVGGGGVHELVAAEGGELPAPGGVAAQPVARVEAGGGLVDDARRAQLRRRGGPGQGDEQGAAAQAGEQAEAEPAPTRQPRALGPQPAAAEAELGEQ